MINLKNVNIVPILCTIIICITVFLFGWFIYPTKYLYTQIGQNNVTIKIDRYNGEIWIIDPESGWKKYGVQE